MQKKKPIFAYSLKYRTIWLQGSLIQRNADRFVIALAKMNARSVQPITFYVSGPGGELAACREMFCAIEESSSRVIIIPYGVVESAIFLLTQSSRFCYAVPRTKFIFHRTVNFMRSLSGALSVRLDRAALSEELNRLLVSDAMQLLIFTRRGRPARKVMDLFFSEATLSAGQARRLGFVRPEFFCEKDARVDIKRLKQELLKTKKRKTNIQLRTRQA